MSSGKRRWGSQDRDRDRDSRDRRGDDRRRDSRRDDRRLDDRRNDHSREVSSSSRIQSSSSRYLGRSQASQGGYRSHSHSRGRSRSHSRGRARSHSRSNSRDKSRRAPSTRPTSSSPTAASVPAEALPTASTTVAAAAAAVPSADLKPKKKVKAPKVQKEPVALPSGWGKSLGPKLVAKPPHSVSADSALLQPLPLPSNESSSTANTESSTSSLPPTPSSSSSAEVAPQPAPQPSFRTDGPPPYGPYDSTQVILDRMVRKKVADLMARKIVARVIVLMSHCTCMMLSTMMPFFLFFSKLIQPVALFEFSCIFPCIHLAVKRLLSACSTSNSVASCMTQRSVLKQHQHQA